MIDIDVKRVEEIIRHVAATEVMPRYNNLLKHEVREKKPGDLVTVADEASERVFTKMLPEVLPGSLVVGEEAVAKDPTVLEKFREGTPVWIIDPIDGTHNFTHGKDKFGILIALVSEGVTQYGWAFDIVGDRMAFAKRGGGAFINGERITVRSKAANMNELSGRGLQPRKTTVIPFKELYNQRCSLHDCFDFITGQADFIVNMPRVTPWDHSATSLLCAEAGGHVAMDEVDTEHDPTRHGGPTLLLVAPDRVWWEKLHALFHPAVKQA